MEMWDFGIRESWVQIPPLPHSVPSIKSFPCLAFSLIDKLEGHTLTLRDVMGVRDDGFKRLVKPSI